MKPPHTYHRLSGIPPWRDILTYLHTKHAFTLAEILIAVSLFATVVTIVGGLYIRSFRETRRANFQNQIYEDARFILQRIATEIRDGMVDYDEYYNQHVVIESLKAGIQIPGAGFQNFAQNYGRYYSAFFNPGNDEKLGFDCNDKISRNKRTCIPLRKTLDRHTGENPFIGKYDTGLSTNEDAFCGTVSYKRGAVQIVNRYGMCKNGEPNLFAERTQKELYLISADGTKRTILARERIGGTRQDPIYALAMLRLDGVDTNNDGIADRFACDSKFQCRGGKNFDLGLNPRVVDTDCSGDLDPMATDLPRSRADELDAGDEKCDPKSGGFSKDFVPISPFRVNVKELKFIITPTENPHYAFSEDAASEQPRVTVLLKIIPNPEYPAQTETFEPLTLIETVSAGALKPIPAPVLVE